MKPRVLIGMLIAGQDLRVFMNGTRDTFIHLNQEIERQELQHTRYVHSLIQNFLNALDQDEDALRDQLEAAIRDLADTVARMEEHATH